MTSQGEAERFLRARFGERVRSLEPLAAGEWSRAFACRLDGRDVVVRFGRHGEDFAKDRVVGDLAAGRLPVPRVLAGGAALDGHFAVSERARGEMLDDLDGAAVRRALPHLLACLEAAQALPVPGRRGFGLWSPDGRAPHRSWPAFLLSVALERPRTAGWRAALARHRVAASAFDVGLTALARAARDLPDVQGLVHCDLLNRNVLVAGGRVSAILDWGNALWGDPLYDQAWLVFWQPWYPAWRAVDMRAALARWRGGRDRGEAEWRIQVYALHIGLDSLTYNAFKGRWDEIGAVARRTRALARRLSRGAPLPSPRQR